MTTRRLKGTIAADVVAGDPIFPNITKYGTGADRMTGGALVGLRAREAGNGRLNGTEGGDLSVSCSIIA